MLTNRGRRGDMPPHRGPFSVHTPLTTQPPLAASPSSHPGPSLILVTHEFHPHRGGIAVYAAEMARAAHELGYSVEVWAPALPAEAAEPQWPFAVRRLKLAGDHSLLSQ